MFRCWGSSQPPTWRKWRIEKGVPTLVRFFGTELAKKLAAEGRCADLVLGNNVLAQVPDLNDFVEGLKVLLKPEGVLTLEFPHLLQLIAAQRVRHDLPRAFLLLLAAQHRQDHGSTRPEGI